MKNIATRAVRRQFAEFQGYICQCFCWLNFYIFRFHNRNLLSFDFLYFTTKNSYFFSFVKKTSVHVTFSQNIIHMKKAMTSLDPNHCRFSPNSYFAKYQFHRKSSSTFFVYFCRLSFISI